MLQVSSLRTFAINASDLSRSEKFYSQVLGASVIRRVEPTEQQRRDGRINEIHVQLGNFQVHIFDASSGPRKGVPHHTVMVPWSGKDQRMQALERAGTKVENIREHPDGKGYSIYVKDPDGNIWELWSAP